LDPEIPVYCSEVTRSYAKCAVEAGRRSLETEVYNYKERPLLNPREPAIPRTFEMLVSGKPRRVGSIEIVPFSIDHSVPGAMAFLVHTSDVTIAYTGDIRLHGVHGRLTERFVEEAAGDGVDILLCEGTNIDETESRTEKFVLENAQKVVSGCEELVVVDFAYKDLDRFLTFYHVARNTDRKIVISKRHAYLLNELRKVSSIGTVPSIDDDCILIYIDRKDTGLYRSSDYEKWERDFLGLANAVKADWIHDHQQEVVACLTFFDMNELIDIGPNPGSICIYSSSEPHNEEQIIDERRLNRWLEFFGLEKYNFHASGHASGTEIRKMVEAINPKKLVPIHTEKPELFCNLHPNVEMPKLEEFQM